MIYNNQKIKKINYLSIAEQMKCYIYIMECYLAIKGTEYTTIWINPESIMFIEMDYNLILFT